ncbi:MAG: class B sortase [Lachnospiraceae bacterium]
MKNRSVFTVFLLIFILSAGVMLVNQIKMKRQMRIYDELVETLAITEYLEDTGLDVPLPDSYGQASAEELAELVFDEKELEKVEIPIDFEKLWEVNKDIYAWISIPGTVINYPVLQHQTDDSYYLNHTIEGIKGYPGTIYTESINDKDFSDTNTVVYGHNMKNGSMFGGLYHYKDAEFMRQYSDIYIYTPEHIYTYQIFGSVIYDDRHILRTYNFEHEQSYQSFLDSLYGSRNMANYIIKDQTVTVQDQLLTLSTCTSSDEQRLLIVAVLIDCR